MKTEKEFLEKVSRQMEAYLQLAFEETKDNKLVFDFVESPNAILSLPITNEHLRHIAGMIYVCATFLKRADHEITFDPGKGVFLTKVIYPS